MMGFCLLAISIILIGFINLHKFDVNPYLWKFTFRLVQKILYTIMLWLIYALVTSVEDVFRSKNSYEPNFRPPAGYKKG